MGGGGYAPMHHVKRTGKAGEDALEGVGHGCAQALERSDQEDPHARAGGEDRGGRVSKK